MRRPVNWVVFCLSLAFLLANLSFGRKPMPPEVQWPATTAVAPLDFASVVVEEPAAVQFGYIHDDGSFEPIAGESTPAARDAGLVRTAYAAGT
jgi:hypothetical protein